VIAFERRPDGVLEVVTTLDVRVARHPVRVAIGPWSGEADPAGPLGLGGTPVVVLPDTRWTELAIAGALRAGRRPAWARIPADGPNLGIHLLVAVGQGAEVLLVDGGDGRVLAMARVLAGRPLAALPLERPASIGDFLAECPYDVHVPVPAADEPVRTAIRNAIEPWALESAHHVVEVDPMPAFAEMGIDRASAPLDAHAAAAAGVLAGRLAATNRRWRADAGS
jgi:hypothetical protein